MKAVNLIPSDDRGARRASGSGLATYAVLGVLALLVVMSAAYTLASRSVDGKREELARTGAQVAATQAKAASLKRYADYANMRKARAERVRSLAESRFDWASSLHEVARTLPSGTWVTSLRATVNPNVALDGQTDPLRGSLAVPAVELVGCAPSHSSVAGVIASLREMSGVERVSISDSQKPEDAASATEATAGGCGKRAQFSLTVFLKAASAATGGATTTTGGTTP
jgi:Tfp pilus assembly protein PilN